MKGTKYCFYWNTHGLKGEAASQPLESRGWNLALPRNILWDWIEFRQMAISLCRDLRGLARWCSEAVLPNSQGFYRSACTEWQWKCAATCWSLLHIAPQQGHRNKSLLPAKTLVVGTPPHFLSA